MLRSQARRAFSRPGHDQGSRAEIVVAIWQLYVYVADLVAMLINQWGHRVVENSLEFDGAPSKTAEIINVDRHAAENFMG